MTTPGLQISSEIASLNDPAQRSAAARRLIAAGTQAADAVPALAWAILNEERGSVRLDLLRALAPISARSADAIPEPALASGDIIRLRLAETQKNDPMFGPAADLIQSQLRARPADLPVGVYSAAIFGAALRKQGDYLRVALDALPKLPEWQIQLTAPWAVPAVVDAMVASKDSRIRDDARWLLYKFGTSSAVCAALLAEHIGHSPYGETFAEVLRKCGPKARESLTLLLGRLDDADPKVRRRAMGVIHAIDSRHKRFVDNLKTMTNDPDEEVRQAASKYLAEHQSYSRMMVIGGVVLLLLAALQVIGVYYLIQWLQ